MTEAEPRVVAIVDDDHAVRESLQFLLEVAGHSVKAFASAAEFLKAEMHYLRCLILDHHMPHMTGLDLAERLREAGVNIPILLVIGSPSPAIVARAAGFGIEKVLEKPLADKDLFDFINAQPP